MARYNTERNSDVVDCIHDLAVAFFGSKIDKDVIVKRKGINKLRNAVWRVMIEYDCTLLNIGKKYGYNKSVVHNGAYRSYYNYVENDPTYELNYVTPFRNYVLLNIPAIYSKATSNEHQILLEKAIRYGLYPYFKKVILEHELEIKKNKSIIRKGT